MLHYSATTDFADCVVSLIEDDHEVYDTLQAILLRIAGYALFCQEAHAREEPFPPHPFQRELEDGATEDLIRGALGSISEHRTNDSLDRFGSLIYSLKYFADFRHIAWPCRLAGNIEVALRLEAKAEMWLQAAVTTSLTRPSD